MSVPANTACRRREDSRRLKRTEIRHSWGLKDGGRRKRIYTCTISTPRHIERSYSEDRDRRNRVERGSQPPRADIDISPSHARTQIPMNQSQARKGPSVMPNRIDTTASAPTRIALLALTHCQREIVLSQGAPIRNARKPCILRLSFIAIKNFPNVRRGTLND